MRVVVVSGGGGALEALAELLQKQTAQRAQSWIAERLGQANNIGIVRRHGGGFVFSTGEKGFNL